MISRKEDREEERTREEMNSSSPLPKSCTGTEDGGRMDGASCVLPASHHANGAQGPRTTDAAKRSGTSRAGGREGGKKW